MKKIKKIALSVTAGIVTAVLAAAVWAGCVLANPRFYGSPLAFDRQTATLSLNGNGDLKILQLADTQVSNLKEALKSYSIVKRAVRKSKPDLLVLTGDNVNNGSSYDFVSGYVEFIDSFGIPWAPVMGNHDYKSAASPQDQSTLYESADYCLFKRGNIPDSYGNYYYLFKRNGKPVYAFIFMDSGKDFRPEHVTWYENTVNEITALNGGNILPSMVFFHIPTEETVFAHEAVERGELTGDGVIREKICKQWVNVGFFQKAKELGSTTTIVYGHDHVNSLVVEYEGILLCYGLKTGRTSYFDNDLLGSNLYVLSSENTLSVQRVYC